MNKEPFSSKSAPVVPTTVEFNSKYEWVPSAAFCKLFSFRLITNYSWAIMIMKLRCEGFLPQFKNMSIICIWVTAWWRLNVGYLKLLVKKTFFRAALFRLQKRLKMDDFANQHLNALCSSHQDGPVFWPIYMVTKYESRLLDLRQRQIKSNQLLLFSIRQKFSFGVIRVNVASKLSW